MSEPTSVVAAAPPPADDNHAPAAPVFLWLVIQLLALSLGALRVPLAARYPPGGEQFAIHILLATQIVASAALFPFLMRDAISSVVVILTIAPFVQLASYLSSVPPTRAALASVYVGIWLATLALWRAVLDGSRRAQLFGVACALALSLGGALIWYASAESRAVAPIDWSRDARFGPILGALAQIEAPASPISAWILAGLLLIPCAALARLKNGAVGRSGSSNRASN